MPIEITQTKRWPGTIVLVTDAKSYGGAEAYLASLYIFLRKSGINTRLLLNEDLLENQSFIRSIDDEAGTNYLRLPSSPSLKGAWKLLQTLKSLPGPVVVHLNFPSPSSKNLIYLPLLCRLAGIKTITSTEHLPRIVCKWKTRVIKWFMSFFVNTTIAVSNSSKAYLSEYFWIPAKKIKVVHNGVSVPKEWSQSSARKSLNIEMSTFVVIQVASLELRKGQSTLLKAAKILLARKPEIDILFIFVGSGKERYRLEEEHRSLCLEKHVRFTGQQDNVQAYYAAANAFALPSEKEAFPLSTLEAMSFALPVIATNVDGIPEQIDHEKNGYLVPPKNAECISTILENLIENPETCRRVGAFARQRVIEEFTNELCHNETLKCWKT